jgi:hypothetical protein
MGIVSLPQPFITNRDINNCIVEFEKIKNDEAPVLTIIAARQMIDIDVLLVGYFILFKAEKRELSIQLKLPHNSVNSPVGKLDIKLPQFATYAYLMTGATVFLVTFKDDERSWIPGKDDLFERKQFGLSRYTMLVLLISKKDMRLYDMLFTTNFSDKTLPRELSLRQHDPRLPWVPDNNEVYKTYQDQIALMATPGRRHEAIAHLGRMAFYNALKQAKILHFFTDKRYQQDKLARFDNMKAGSLDLTATPGNNKYISYDYYENVKPIFDSLAGLPIIYHLVFSMVTSSELLPGTLTAKSMQAFQERLYSLWNFTKDMVHGLIELVKNIIEHTNEKTGIVTARMYLSKNFKVLLDQSYHDNSIYNDHLQALSKENGKMPNSLLDNHDADLGTKGVEPQLMKE